MAPTKRELKLLERFERMSLPEKELAAKGFRYVAGFDEAGRGPIAGPVYAAAVILNPADPILGLNDSKKLSAAVRDTLAEEIKARAIAWAVVSKDARTIDRINILEATKVAMAEALSLLEPQPDYLLLDALFLSGFPRNRQQSLIHGDQICNAISAASILAKTARDTEMIQWDELYPAYGFASHKGYGTAAHYQALDEYGPIPLHRETFLRTWYERRQKL